MPSRGKPFCLGLWIVSVPICRAALSISSGYESFLVNIRQRIVVEESNIIDEALQSGVAQPCDSMRDGPFCRGLPTGALPNHWPFTIDSIIPQHLFGEDTGEGDGTHRQAMETLNRFLETYYNPREGIKRLAVEGRLDLQRVPLAGDMPKAFSRGLPAGIQASWHGAWQPSHGPRLDSASGVGTALRVNGAVTKLRFSRAVVVRHLRLHPPLDSGGASRLVVRGRKAGLEVWSSGHDHGGASSDMLPLCRVGETALCKFTDDQFHFCRILNSYLETVTVAWQDGDERHRVLHWKHVRTLGGIPCTARRKDRSLSSENLWRDLAQSTKSVDEVSFTVPEGEFGWLLGEIVVAVEVPGNANVDAKTGLDTSLNVVQVLPNTRTMISDISGAAVVYDADDMLERGLRVRREWQAEAVHAWDESELRKGPKVGEGPQRVNMGNGRSVEAFQQLLRSLSADSELSLSWLPAHISPYQLVSEVTVLVNSLSASVKEVKKHTHFESFFAALWDRTHSLDALHVTFERWRRSTIMQTEAEHPFTVGQLWKGSYFCTQGPTSVTLNITSVESEIVADLRFQFQPRVQDSKTKGAVGTFTVAGRFESEGRFLSLEPVPGSWKQRPSNFVMVGLSGVVSERSGEFRYAGSVPLSGCDSFVLSLLKAAGEASTSLSQHTRNDLLAYRAVLRGLNRAVDGARARWRRSLEDVISQKDATKKSVSTQVAQLVETAKNQGLLSFMTEEGGELVVQIGGN